MKRVVARTARLLVVDDDASYRAWVSAFLEAAGYAPVAAESAEEALHLLRSSPPALVLLDVGLPRVCGYELCRAIREDLRLDIPIIFVSGERIDSVDRVAGLTIGADDYLVKPVAPDELLARVRSVLRRADAVPQGRSPELSKRESEVLWLLAEGLDQREIAARLVISPKTVGTHIERILDKLGVHSRAEAVAAAYRRGLVPVPA